MGIIEKIFGKRNSSSEKTEISSVCYEPDSHYKQGDYHFDISDDEPSVKERSLVLFVGGKLSYKSIVYGSVGIWWKASFDETIFSKERNFSYNDPEANERCNGADEATVIETYTALRKG